MDKTIRDRALQHFPYGLYVVGAVNGRAVATIVANWATQVSFSPALVAIAIEHDSRMRAHIEMSGFFSINMLPPNKTEIARSFVKPRETNGNDISGRRFERAKNGTPFLHDAVACIECRVVHAYPAGDHLVFVGEVTDAMIHKDGRGEVLTLRQTGWRYHR